MRHLEEAHLINGDHPLPFVRIRINNGAEQHQPRVVDEDIKMSEPVDDCLDCRLGSSTVGDIGGHSECGPAQRGQDMQSIVAARDQGDGCALSRESPSCGVADSAARSGDERHGACE